MRLRKDASLRDAEMGAMGIFYREVYPYGILKGTPKNPSIPSNHWEGWEFCEYWESWDF